MLTFLNKISGQQQILYEFSLALTYVKSLIVNDAHKSHTTRSFYNSQEKHTGALGNKQSTYVGSLDGEVTGHRRKVTGINFIIMY